MTYIPFKNLCKYYIDCIVEDSTDNISAFVDSRNPSYILMNNPEFSSRESCLLNINELRKFEEVRANQSKGNQIKKWWYGFPLCYTYIKSKTSDWKGFVIKPIFYLPLEFDMEDRLTVSLNSPRINYEALQDLGLEIEESRNLAEELKIFENLEDQKSLELIYNQFRNIYPALRHDNPSNDSNYIKSEGAIFCSEGSPFTQGVEAELKKIIDIDQSSIKSTALGTFFPELNSKKDDKKFLLKLDSSEVIKLNEEQQAVLHSVFSNDLTVVTGPPGTGKSQVVASIIINAARNGQRVLFASKNQKAVDVVEERLNKFAKRPFIIRLGIKGSDDRDLRGELTAYLNSLSGAAPDQNLIEEHKRKMSEVESIKTERDEIKKRIEDYRQLRNKLLKANDQFTTRVFNSIGADSSNKLLSKCKNDIKTLKKILWNFTSKNRSVLNYTRLNEAANQGENIENLCEELDKVEKKITRESEKEFELWLNTLPSRIEGNKRHIITNFASLIKSFNNAGANTPKNVWARLYKQREQLMFEVSGILPAWCVTNLSAKGALPLIKGMFDLLIVDEASQCDIPSAIPLMYRAKKVVVIGDPNQLQHITSIPTDRSLTLMSSNDLFDSKFLTFEYTNNSLFHCAAGFTDGNSIIMLKEHFRSHEDIINFSNRKWYGGNLSVETDYRNLLPLLNICKSNVTWVETSGTIIQEAGSGAYIENECNKIVEIVTDIISDLKFRGDLGVVTPFRLQAKKIHEKLIKSIKNEVWLKTKLIVNTATKFQGDERDVIIFSPVIAANMPRGPKYYIESTPNLLNVSLTRAKSQLIIVGNKSACINSGISMIKELAEYVNELELKKNQVSQQEQIGSQYAEILYDALFKENIVTIPLYVVNQYRLDLAFINKEIQVDIEIEDDNNHKAWDEEKLKKEIMRNLRLQKLGWKIVRIWPYEIRDNVGECVVKIKEVIGKQSLKHFSTNNNVKKDKKKTRYENDKSFNEKSSLDKILEDNIKILEMAITEHSEVTFRYLISDREKELDYRITPQRIIEGRYLVVKVGEGVDKTFKIEIMKDIRKI